MNNNCSHALFLLSVFWTSAALAHTKTSSKDCSAYLLELVKKPLSLLWAVTHLSFFKHDQTQTTASLGGQQFFGGRTPKNTTHDARWCWHNSSHVTLTGVICGKRHWGASKNSRLLSLGVFTCAYWKPSLKNMPSVCHVTHFCQDKNMFLQCMAVFDVQKLSNKSKKKSKKYSQILKAGMSVNVKQKNSVTFRAESWMTERAS